MSGIDILMIVLLGSTVLLLLNLLQQRQDTKKLYRIQGEREIKEKEGIKFEFSYFKKLKNNINLYFHFKKNKQMGTYFYYGILVTEFVFFVGFLFANKVIFAVLLPPITHFFMIKLFDLITVNIHNYIQAELPIAIKHFIKVLTKTSDLKTVVYETSRELSDPLRSMFFDLSRKMITENHEKCLMDLAEEVDDIWMYAFTFLLISYKEQSKKEDIIKNLTTLADMLYKENDVKEKSITDKKFVVIMNYAILAVGIAGLFANLVFNDSAKPFFFESPMGMLALIVGILSCLGTVLVNLIMTHRTP